VVGLAGQVGFAVPQRESAAGRHLGSRPCRRRRDITQFELGTSKVAGSCGSGISSRGVATARWLGETSRYEALGLVRRFPCELPGSGWNCKENWTAN